MVLALVTDRIRAGVDLDFNIVLTVLGKEINIRDDAPRILNLVRNILKELLAVRGANYFSIVTNADIDFASTDPL